MGRDMRMRGGAGRAAAGGVAGMGGAGRMGYRHGRAS
jgi:hypothetical protein